MRNMVGAVEAAVTLASLTWGVLMSVMAQQGGMDPISGGAGWVGAGLLGLVLGWIFIWHLPAKDKQLETKDIQLEKMLAAKDGVIKSQAEAHLASVRELASAHLAAVKEQALAHMAATKEVVDRYQKEDQERTQSFERRYGDVINWLRQISDSCREAVHETRNLAGSVRTRTRLADAVQSAEVPIWTKNLSGVLLGWNMACERVLGWKPAEVIGKSVYTRIIPPEKKGEEEDVLRRIGRGETVEKYVTERVSSGGHRVRMAVTTSPIVDPSGQIIGAMTIGEEV